MSASYHSNSNTIESLRADIIAMQKDMSSMRTQLFNQMNRVPFNEIANLAGFSAVGRKFQNRSAPSSYSTSSHNQNVSTVPLQGYHSSANEYRRHKSHRVQTNRRPHVPSRNTESEQGTSAIHLSNLLKNGEEVTFRVIVGKDEAGNAVYTHTVATFDGTNFNVTSSELVPSLVGLTSSKPGEILYKLIDGLTQSGHLTRKFSIAPWRLCFVKRDGNYVSLNQLRLDSLNRA